MLGSLVRFVIYAANTMGRSRCSLLIFGVTHLQLVSAVGYMSTISAMWLSTVPQSGEYSVCSLRPKTLTANCGSRDPGIPINFSGNNPPLDIPFYALSGGGYFTCGLQQQTHFPVCWGNLSVSEEYKKVRYANLNSGGWHACAVRLGSDQVDCWGNNVRGQSQPPSNQDFWKVTAGDQFTCGLSRSSSKATCWGQMTVPDPGAMFENIYAGRIHVCGIEQGTRKTLCWGDNRSKQCEPPVGVKFQAISGGLLHTCGLKEDAHEAICWGDNSKSQLQVPNGTAFSSIAAGDWYTCGVTMDEGAIRCWGTFNGTLDGIKTNRGLCSSSSCNSGEYADHTGVCTSGETVCLACSQGPCPESGQTEIAPCNKTSDRVCGAGNSVVEAPPPKTGNKKTGPNIVGIVGGVVGGLAAVAAVAAVAGVAGFICRRHAVDASVRGDDRWDDLANRAVAFSSVALQVATRNYGEDMILGRGAFGVVYKGILPNGQVVAIKRAASPGTSSTFDKELELLGRINHVNLVNLVGYCKAERLLVFEFMENGSLYDCLFRKPELKLRASRRVRIALQAARGIEYLHEYSTPRVIHRDIKTANVLLDAHWNAHVSDFGLSVFGPVPGENHLSNMTVVGTPGYLDPEYFQTLRLTSKSDVYSFGVVLLELTTDRKIVITEQSSVQEGIVSWVSNLVEENRAADTVADLSVRHDFTSCGGGLLQQILQLALDCTKPRGRDRPSMSFVAKKLEELSELLLAQATWDKPGSSDSSTALRSFDTPAVALLSEQTWSRQ